MARKKSLLQAARSDDRLAELQAARRLVAESLSAAKRAGDWRSISPLTGKLMDLGREIEALKERDLKPRAVDVPDEPFDPETI